MALDPRFYQIAVLGSLLAYGILALEFEVTVGRAAVVIGSVLLTQHLCTRLWKLPAFDPKSALLRTSYLYTLTRKGRVEATNYRTVKLPTGMELPAFVKNEFGRFYGAMFGEQVRRQDMRTVFVEYAWDMGWCDPCAADPLSNDELRRLGVF